MPKPAQSPLFTPKQAQYLAFIYAYTRVQGRPPAAADLQRHFKVSPPSVHQMLITLERNGLSEASRSVRVDREVICGKLRALQQGLAGRGTRFLRVRIDRATTRGHRDLAVRRFVDRMQPPQTERRRIADALLARVVRAREIERAPLLTPARDIRPPQPVEHEPE
ncbi:MAG: hypothetical protein E6K47_08200 [Gammaproteobacteria bacterium]|nr:MAG: hypothetical protein E6K47_08200 [Gammaproteobacteria bacterium]